MSQETITQRVIIGQKILTLNDLINDLEYELYQGIYNGEQAVNVRTYIEHLKEQVNQLNNQTN